MRGYSSTVATGASATSRHRTSLVEHSMVDMGDSCSLGKSKGATTLQKAAPLNFFAVISLTEVSRMRN